MPAEGLTLFKLATTMVFEVDPSLPNPDDLRTDSVLAVAREEYARTRTGPLAILPVSISYVPAATFTSPAALSSLLSSLPSSPSSSTSTPSRDTLLRERFTTHSHNLGHVEFIFDLGNWGINLPPSPTSPTPKKYGSLLQILQYPFSTGTVHIQPPSPSNPNNPSLSINPQYFSPTPQGEFDLTLALHAHHFARRLASTAPLSSIIRSQVWPPQSETTTDDEIKAWLRLVATTDWHPVGTCAMGGSKGIEGGVVDERLRVYGVRGLRVVDASVMPVQISAHLQATVYAIAEKGAAMILEDWGVVG